VTLVEDGSRVAGIGDVFAETACILALTCYGNRVGDFGVPGL